MSKLEQTIRFMVGLALVATGVSVASPFVLDVLAAYSRTPAAASTAAEPEAAVLAATRPATVGYASHAIRDRRLGGWEHQPLTASDIAPPPAEFSPALDVPSRDYRPPAPPGPLPRVAVDMSRSTPQLDSAYRSTLDVPPPPLLDADSPPPLAVAWSANDTARTTAGRPIVPPAAGGSTAVQQVPQAPASTYIVRDGDDLTGIATKIYGNPGAASVIWSVNRDRLTDPALLPIGSELRIPPAWSLPTADRQGGAVIEPSNRPASVRVGPGETLETLAQRFYGNRAMAPRLWEANRDRLRNPALLVTGMEIRLP